MLMTYFSRCSMELAGLSEQQQACAVFVKYLGVRGFIF
jgi:hypothetical protein